MREVELVRALAEDLALEILASYTADDFKDADFTSLGNAAVYLQEHGHGPGPVLQELIVKIQVFAGSEAERPSGSEPPIIGQP